MLGPGSGGWVLHSATLVGHAIVVVVALGAWNVEAPFEGQTGRQDAVTITQIFFSLGDRTS